MTEARLVTKEQLAAALATLNGGAPVEVRPMSMSWDAYDIAEHHQGVAERIFAALPAAAPADCPVCGEPMGNHPSKEQIRRGASPHNPFADRISVVADMPAAAPAEGLKEALALLRRLEKAAAGMQDSEAYFTANDLELRYARAEARAALARHESAGSE